MVSEMVICGFREVPVEADRLYSKTQCGNCLLKMPHANTGLPGSNEPHPTVCAIQASNSANPFRVMRFCSWEKELAFYKFFLDLFFFISFCFSP